MSSRSYGKAALASPASSAAAAACAAAWDTMYDKLVEFHQTQGHCRIPKSDFSLKNLYDWVSYQRRNEALSQQQRAVLDELGFDWTTQDQNRESRWNEMFESLEAYKAANGDCRVSRSFCEDLKLYAWVSRQRSNNNKGKLPRRRRNRLRAMGFCWDASKPSNDTSQSKLRDPAPAQGTVLAQAELAGEKTSWDVMYEKLALCYRIKGNCSVSKSKMADLHNWIVEQRMAYSNNELSAVKRLKLDQIHFPWIAQEEKQEELWNEMFESLKAYKAANGDCLVPHAYQRVPKLFNWAKAQRYLKKKRKLPRHRRDRLRGIGFCWDVNLKPKETKQAPSLAVPRTQPNPIARGTTSVSLPSSNSQQTRQDAHGLMLQKQWDEMFERLQAYAAVNGDHFVLYADDRQLYYWVDKQRYNYRQGILLQHRREKLESIGFDWDARKPKISRATEPRGTAILTMKNHSVPVVSQRWNLQLERLKIYQAWYGDCLVPTSFDKELAEWVSCQHYLHEIDKLGEPRYGKLERIGFFLDAEEKFLNGGTKRGATARDSLESEAQLIAGAQDLPDGTDSAAKRGADLSRSPKRARVDGVTPSISMGRAERD